MNLVLCLLLTLYVPQSLFFSPSRGSIGVGGWPAADTFVRADETLGAPNWTQGDSAHPLKIIGNSATVTAWSSPDANHPSVALWSAAGYTFTANQYSQAVVTLKNAGIAGPVVRGTDANNFYYLDWGGNIQKRVGGATAWIGAPTGCTAATGDTLRLEIIGTTLKGYRNGAACSPTYTDSSLSSGSAGVFVQGYTPGPSKLNNFQANNCTTTCPVN